jgi:N-acetylglutamate synthase-like GNAT family acetyltransferase
MQITIKFYNPKYAFDFEQLNLEWLLKYFVVEKHDTEMLSNPEKYIIQKGGEIIFALSKNKVVGTVALIKLSEEQVELAKMAVTESFKGNNIGNLLLKAAIKKAKEMNFSTIILESNRKLKPAIYLYKKYGFKEVELSKNSAYVRADIRMIKSL